MSEININLRETYTIGRDTREIMVHPKQCPPLSLYGIALTGISNASSEFNFVRIKPQMVQFMACLEGAGEVLVDGAWRRCEPGSAYISPRNAPHAYHALPGSRWRLGWIQFRPSAPAVHTMGVNRPALLNGDYRTLEIAIENLYQESRGAADPGILSHWTALINAYALRALQPRTRLAPIWDAVREDLSRDWTVAEMAQHACMSGEHLRRLCTQEVGASPMRHLTRLRMREAATMLFSDRYKMQEIAERVGYDNAFAFSTAFKRCFGRTPSEYRAHGPDQDNPDP